MTKGVVASVAVWCMVVLVVVQTAAAVTCDPSELRSCGPAVIRGKAPTAECCIKLKEQQPCLCGYIKDPKLKPFIDNPNTKKAAAVCGVSIPKC